MLVDRSGLFTTDVLAGALPLRTGLTIATRVGEGPEIALSALACLLVAAAGFRRRGAAAAEKGGAARSDDAPAAAAADRGEPVSAATTGEQAGAQG
jgi:hypothetical protein